MRPDAYHSRLAVLSDFAELEEEIEPCLRTPASQPRVIQMHGPTNSLGELVEVGVELIRAAGCCSLASSLSMTMLAG